MNIDKKILNKIDYLGNLYQEEYLKKYTSQLLEKDWWNGLSLFLNHSFYQGRRDEVSEQVEKAAMNILKNYFPKQDISDIDKRDLENIKKELVQVIGKRKIGKARDIEMIIDILRFVKKLYQKNLTTHSLKIIKDNKEKPGSIRRHYEELKTIRQIGDKIASFYLRDLVSIYKLDDYISNDDLRFLQPIDVWVRKVAFRIGIISDDRLLDDKVRIAIVNICKLCGLSSLKFNQGAWYLGKKSFDILLNNIEKINIK